MANSTNQSTGVLSKEEILQNIHKSKVLNWEKVFYQNPTIIESAYEAMSQYAQQQERVRSIAFANFINDNTNQISNNWDYEGGGETVIKTTEQLYEIFSQTNQ